jgi:hypothetical protein
MRLFFTSMALLFSLLLSGCFDRESELQRLWRKTQDIGTQQAYLEFLAEQKHGEDGEFKPKGYTISSTDRLRSFAARRALIEIAREGAVGQCPFQTISFELDQDIRGVQIPLDVKSRLDGKLNDIGVEFVDAPANAEEVLHITLRGTGEGSYYTDYNSQKNRYSITGGSVNGTMWFKSDINRKHEFSGRKQVSNYIFVDPNIIPRSSKYSVPHSVLDAARFDDALARLLFEACAPATAALFYLNNRPKGAVRDDWLEARFMEERESAYPVLLGAAFSTSVYNDQVGRDLVLDMATEDVARTIRAALLNIWPKLELPE